MTEKTNRSAVLPDPNVQQLTEHIRDWRSGDLLVDHERRLVLGVALSGTKSKNGYRYSEQALREAIPLYENKPVFLDHAASPARPFQRSTRDLVGSVVNPRFEDGRLRGDIQALDTEAGRTFIALAEGESPAVGMSHVVLAERNRGKSFVEKIHDVVSIDAVVFPATTSTLREGALTSGPSSGGRGENAATESGEPDDEIAVLNEKLGHLQADLDVAVQERDRLRRELDQLQCEREDGLRRREVERLLAEAGLPDYAVTERLWSQLLAAADNEARCELIAERRELLERLSVQPPTSRERLEPAARFGDETIIAAIRRR